MNGAVTVPIRIQKRSEAVPAGIVTLCPNVAVSADVAPPNHAQMAPVRGGEAPAPLPHPARSHSGVPKFVEVCGLFHIVLGMPPVSNPPSRIMFVVPGEHVGVGDAVPVGVFVGVFVGVPVGVNVGVIVGVFVGVPGVGVFVGVPAA